MDTAIDNTGNAAGVPPSSVRRGSGHWLSSYAAILRFDIASQRTWLPMFLMMQILFGTGTAIIYGFYLGPGMSRSVALFIVSGAPALAAITAALIGVTTMVTERKLAGSWDFIWSLPAPRSAVVASTLTVYTLMTVPGVVACLALATWRYGLQLSLSPMVVPAFVLAALITTSLAFGMALAIPSPLVTNVIVNALIFVILLFSPVVYPITQLPGWLADVHRVLPIYHLAQILRASVTSGLVHDVAASYAILAGWTVVAWTTTAWITGRRK